MGLHEHPPARRGVTQCSRLHGQTLPRCPARCAADSNTVIGSLGLTAGLLTSPLRCAVLRLCLQEIDALLDLDHPNVVALKEYFVWNNKVGARWVL